jgi:hypothetical protein
MVTLTHEPWGQRSELIYIHCAIYHGGAHAQNIVSYTMGELTGIPRV